MGARLASLRGLATLVCLATVATSAAQPIYKTTSEDGTPVFSDQRAPGAEPVELDEGNVFAPPTDAVPAADAGATPESPPAERYDVRITQPADEASVRSNNGDLTVTAAMEPSPGPGARFELLLDGVAVARGDGGTFDLDALDRGTHRLQVRVLGADGGILATSDTVTFYLLRASRLN